MKHLMIAALIALPLASAAQAAPGAHFIENWDLNGDGHVTVAELTQKRGDVFYTFDADENGLLDAEEYGYFDDARKADMEGQAEHAKGKMGKVQEGMILTFNDVDSDGQVSRDEFLGRAGEWLALIDRDGSGDITSADFGGY